MAAKKTSARGERLPTVTSIIGRFKDSGALIHWAWKTGMAGKELRAARELTVGVLVEQLVEDHLLGTTRPLPSATAEQLETARRCFEGFRSWASEHGVTLVEHQVELTSDQHRFIGRVDAIIRLDGELAVVDWKVANGVYLDHLLQLAAYRLLLWERAKDPVPRRAAIIQIGKEDGVVRPHEWDEDTLRTAEQMFLALRAAWDFDKALKPIFKAA